MASTLVATSPSIEPIKLLAQVVQEQMKLDAGQIMLAFENWEIPENPGLYVSLAYGVETVIGNVNFNSLDDEGNYVEVQGCTMMHQVAIDVMSFDDSARLRKQEVLWALASENAQALMNAHSMRIASTPGSFITITAPEPTKQLNRYQITVEVYALHQNVIKSAYYDTLQTVKLVENP